MLEGGWWKSLLIYTKGQVTNEIYYLKHSMSILTETQVLPANIKRWLGKCIFDISILKTRFFLVQKIFVVPQKWHHTLLPILPVILDRRISLQNIFTCRYLFLTCLLMNSLSMGVFILKIKSLKNMQYLLCSISDAIICKKLYSSYSWAKEINF